MRMENTKLENALAAMTAVGLSGLDAVKLMSRVDSKYIFHASLLPAILNEVRDDYQILEIDGKRQFQYDSVYLDSPDFDFYKDHHRGKPNRTKMRYRHYVDTGSIYFEVKKKIKGARTDKFRIKVPEISQKLSSETKAMIERLGLKSEGLELKYWVCYQRITLASAALEERVTIDLGLTISDENNKQVFDDLVIVEVKQGKRTRTSPMVADLRKNSIRECRLSKYTVAVAKLGQPIKANAFKEKLLKLQKIIAQ